MVGMKPHLIRLRSAAALPAWRLRVGGSLTSRRLTGWIVVSSALLLLLLAACTNQTAAGLPIAQTSPLANTLTVTVGTTLSATQTARASTTPTPPAAKTAPPDATKKSATTSTPPSPNTQAGSAPAPAPVGTVIYYEESVTLPTYPVEKYQTDARDSVYNWPYKKFDVERFRTEAPKPVNRTYRVVVLENSYLKVMILPQIGGRIWQVIHKPSGKLMFYQNSVVKPTHWGNVNQLGWLALGGLEWNLPVIEHGYDWGSEWGFIPLQQSEDLATVTLFTPQDGRYVNASITISLRAGAAAFEIEPTISNLSKQTLSVNYWEDALLAPGSGKQPSAQLHFVLPTDKMTIHSTFDKTLPQPDQTFTWPIYNGRDLSILGNWQQYIGFFEAPAAHGPFTGLYDKASDTGAVRIYPADVARGSKVFGLGWADRLGSDNFADDNSFYVELHGGLAPSFATEYPLPAGGSVNWREIWYPVHGIGDLTFANEVAALQVQASKQGLQVGLYPVRPLAGTLVATVGGKAVARQAVQVRPDAPFNGLLTNTPVTAGKFSIQLLDDAGRVLLTYPAP